MKRRLLSLALALAALPAAAESFVYRGSLQEQGAPANGRYDLRLTLLDARGNTPLLAPVATRIRWPANSPSGAARWPNRPLRTAAIVKRSRKSSSKYLAVTRPRPSSRKTPGWGIPCMKSIFTAWLRSPRASISFDSGSERNG